MRETALTDSAPERLLLRPIPIMNTGSPYLTRASASASTPSHDTPVTASTRSGVHLKASSMYSS